MARRTPIIFMSAILAMAAGFGILLYRGISTTAVSSYSEAQEYIKSGDLRAARIALMNAVKENPGFLSALVEQAHVNLELFDAPGAQIALERALVAGVKKDQIAHLLGHAYWLQGELDTAESLLLSPNIPPENHIYALRILGRVKMDRGDLAAAQISFDEAIRIDPKDSRTWTEIARLRFVQGNQKGAIEAVDYAFKLDPQNVRALEFRGRLMRSQFGVVAALPWFEHGLQINPNDVPLLEEYTLTLGDAGRYRDMLSQSRKILSIDPNNPRAYFAQAVLAARAGEYALAGRLLSKTGPAFSEVPAALLLSAICEFETGNSNRAVDQLQILLGQQPRNQQVRTLLAQALYKAGDPDGALDVIREIASRGDADSYSLTLTARAFAASDQPDRAVDPLNDAAFAAFRAALPLPEPVSLADAAATAQREPDNAQAVLPYIRLLATEGQFEPALREARRLQGNNAGVAEAHIIVGDLELSRSNLSVAIEEYQNARAIRFTEPVMLRLVDALSRANREKEADQILAAYVTYNPANLSALRLSGYRYLDAKNWPLAIAMLEKVRRRLGNNDVILLANIARAYAGAGQRAKATAFARTAYNIAPSNPMVTHVYGQILLQSGRRPKAARELLQKAVILMPENRQAAAELRQAEQAYARP